MKKVGKFSTIVILFVLGILVLFGMAFLRKPISEHFSTSHVPKIIWTYWDNPDTIPKTVKLCMDSWKKYNPNYTIRLLTKANYSEYVHIPNTIAAHPLMNDMPQRFADLVRCYVIAEHGGVWVDSSTLMGESLDSWLFPRPAEFYGFTIVYGGITDRAPILENWFFAAPAKSPFVIAWRDEFAQLTQFPTNQNYIDSRLAMGVDIRGWHVSPNYLTMHVAAQKLLQIDRYPLDGLMLWPSEKGPFRYVVEHGWNAQKALAAACEDPTYRRPFLKLRGVERAALESELDGTLSNARCKWV
jgi:hypothetical protein